MDGGRQTPLPDVFAVLLIGLAPDGGNLLFVSRHGGEGLIGYAFIQFLLPDEADDGVAAFDVMVQEVERLAGVVRLKPEGDLAQLDGQRIEVNSVDAGPDHVAEGGAKGWGRRLFFARPHDGEFRGDSSCSGQQDVARAAGDIRDAQIEQRGFRFGGFEALGDQVVERVFDERLDEIVRSVVRTRGVRVRRPARTRIRRRCRGREMRARIRASLHRRSRIPPR